MFSGFWFACVILFWVCCVCLVLYLWWIVCLVCLVVIYVGLLNLICLGLVVLFCGVCCFVTACLHLGWIWVEVVAGYCVFGVGIVYWTFVLCGLGFGLVLAFDFVGVGLGSLVLCFCWFDLFTCLSNVFWVCSWCIWWFWIW